jgi:hypothetical protein
MAEAWLNLADKTARLRAKFKIREHPVATQPIEAEKRERIRSETSRQRVALRA